MRSFLRQRRIQRSLEFSPLLRRICSFFISSALLLSLCSALFTGCSSNHNSAGAQPPGSGSGGGGAGGGSGGGGSGGGSGGGGTGGGSGSGGSASAAEYLYMVADGQQGSVYEFKIDTGAGVFTQISGSPFTADVGNPARVCTVGCGASLLADPLGRFLYYQYNYGGSAGSATNAVDSLSVSATDGTLSSNSKVLQGAYEMSADPQGRFIYWNDTNGTANAVGGFDVSSAGKLATAPGQPYTYNGQISYGAPAVTGTYVFAINYRDPSITTSQGELLEWTIDSATGALTQTRNTLPLPYGGDPVVTPNGKFLYVQQAYLNNNVFNWEILPIQVGPDGSFTPLTQNLQQTPSQGDSDMWMSPNGNFLYISINGQIWDYQIDQTTGALTLVQKYTDVHTNLMAIDPAVKYVFTSPEGQNQIATTTLTEYTVNPTTGALSPVQNSTVDLKVLPISLAVVAPH